MSKESSGVGESPTGKPISKMSTNEMAQLSKPIIFGNHQKLFKLFSWAVGAGKSSNLWCVCLMYCACAGIVYYMVLHHDFGEKEHCFTKVGGMWSGDHRPSSKRQNIIVSSCKLST